MKPYIIYNTFIWESLWRIAGIIRIPTWQSAVLMPIQLANGCSSSSSRRCAYSQLPGLRVVCMRPYIKASIMKSCSILVLLWFQIYRPQQFKMYHNTPKAESSNFSLITNQFSTAPLNFSNPISARTYITAYFYIYILHSLFRLSLSQTLCTPKSMYKYATFHSHHSRIIFSPRPHAHTLRALWKIN